MQKNLKFSKFSRLKTAFFAIAALVLFILSANALVLPKTQNKTESGTHSSTIYKRLENLSAEIGEQSPPSEKMNNSVYKNSNAYKNADGTFNISKISVYDAQTGKVRDMDLEYYTLCALIAEMPQSFESSALMAQAVACRTFAVRKVYEGKKHSGADVCTDFSHCQSFRDAESADYDIQKAVDAVNATRGIIATFGGEPIVAAYHASSAFYTKSCSDVWGGETEYLVSVAAPESLDDISFTVRYASDEVRSKLKKVGLNGSIGFISDRDGFLQYATDGVSTVTPRELKNALGLRSDVVKVSEDGKDTVFTTYGYGHGVGMSQYGANALAEQGYDFYEILKYYYTGIGFAFIKS